MQTARGPGGYARGGTPAWVQQGGMEYVCFQRAKELHKLVRELIDTYAISEEWKHSGTSRAYTSSVFMGPEGIKKGKDTEWHRTEIEGEAPASLSMAAAFRHSVARFKIQGC